MKSYVVILALCGLFRCGCSIRCYSCNSVTNAQCHENVLPESLMANCSELDQTVPYTLCRKITQYVDYSISDQMPISRVIRSCGWDDNKYKDKCYHLGEPGAKQEVCSCSTDSCNSGHHVTVTTSLIIAMCLVSATIFLP